MAPGATPLSPRPPNLSSQFEYKPALSLKAEPITVIGLL